MRKFLYCFTLLSGLVFGQNSHAAPQSHVDMSAKVFPHQGKIILAVSLLNEKKWHTYWKNPGDAGLPVKFEFKAGDKNIEPEEKEWQPPKRYLEAGDILTYGYEGLYHFFFELSPEQLKAIESNGLNIHGKWLVCKDICIPGEERTSLQALAGRGESGGAPRPSIALLKEAYDNLPSVEEPPKELEIFLAKAAEEDKLSLQYSLANVDIENIDRERNLLTPFLAAPLDYKREKLYYDAENRTLYGIMTADWDGEYEDPPRPLPEDGEFRAPVEARFLFQPYRNGRPVVIEKSFKNFSLGGQQAFANFLKGLKPLGEEGEPVESSGQAGLAMPMALLFAFIGGLILNLMPCVLPVISLKLFGLIAHSDESKKQIIKHNMAYTGGILATFWVLAGAVLALKAGGQQIGWGFQLQSPGFVFVMMTVMLVLAMNMMGLFEFVTPGGTKLGNAQMKKGASADFINGVLATILSTPCSAPFLGAALTFAFTTSSLNIFLTLSFVGLGLAFPFILTAFFPKLASFLPRPGMWMERLKKILGLTLLLTFVWLYDILSSQIDYDFFGVYINTIFVTLFFAFFFRKSITKSLPLNIIFFMIPAALTFHMVSKGGLEVSEASAGAGHKSELNWQPWSRKSMRELKGEWVFMDFTADWCLTCKVNEKLVLQTDDFSRLVKERNVKLLLGDWTKRDDRITSFLNEHGVVGVPAYFVQRPNGEVVKLGELISVEKVKESLE